MTQRSPGDDGFVWPVPEDDLDALEALPVAKTDETSPPAPPASQRFRTPMIERSALVMAGMVLGAFLVMLMSSPSQDGAPAADGAHDALAEVRALADDLKAQVAQVDARLIRVAAAASPPDGIGDASSAAPAAVAPAPANPARARRAGPPAAPRRPTAPAPALDLVQRYARAYARMDAGAVQALWPSADRDALVSTFTARREQRLTLSRCRGRAADDGAVVTCQGTLRYRTRVDDRGTRVRRGVWSFALSREDTAWQIEDVTAP